jgi:hypothetical protein
LAVATPVELELATVGVVGADGISCCPLEAEETMDMIGDCRSDLNVVKLSSPDWRALPGAGWGALHSKFHPVVRCDNGGLEVDFARGIFSCSGSSPGFKFAPSSAAAPASDSNASIPAANSHSGIRKTHPICVRCKSSDAIHMFIGNGAYEDCRYCHRPFPGHA